MICSQSKTDKTFQSYKSFSERNGCSKSIIYSPKTTNLNKLGNLRQMTTEKALQQDVFSQNFGKRFKGNLSIKNLQNQILSIKTLKQYIQSKILISNIPTRKQSENNITIPIESRIHLNGPQTQRPVYFKILNQQKSPISTKANSEQSEKQTIQRDYFKSENNIINLNQIQNRIKQQLIKKDKQITIDDFDILNFCGEGVLGSVYIARHKVTNGIFALKKIVKSNLVDEKDKSSLVREIKIHMKLNHPNIIKFYGCFSSDKAVYFILELCNQGNLYQMIQDNENFEEKQSQTLLSKSVVGQAIYTARTLSIEILKLKILQSKTKSSKSVISDGPVRDNILENLFVVHQPTYHLKSFKINSMTRKSMFRVWGYQHLNQYMERFPLIYDLNKIFKKQQNNNFYFQNKEQSLNHVKILYLNVLKRIHLNDGIQNGYQIIHFQRENDEFYFFY